MSAPDSNSANRPSAIVLAREPEYMARARVLAQRIGLPLRNSRTAAHRFVLSIGRDGVMLEDAVSGLAGIRADWSAPAVRRRVQGGRRQPLARAAALHKTGGTRVLDACAGLGTDGYVLASLGARVTMTEREPAIFALLEDALGRARHALDAPEHAASARIDLAHADAADWLKQCPSDSLPDVVYLDPMYPGRGKAALPSKEMQVLRALLGDRPRNAARLLETALRTARRRVVVKRPARAKPLREKPDFSYTGKQTRYDVYLTAGPGATGP